MLLNIINNSSSPMDRLSQPVLLEAIYTAMAIHFFSEDFQSSLYKHGNSQIDGLVQERHNSSALAMELRLSCINPSKCIIRKFAHCHNLPAKDNVLSFNVMKRFEKIWIHMDGLVQERHNSSALTMKLRLSSTNPSIHSIIFWHWNDAGSWNPAPCKIWTSLS